MPRRKSSRMGSNRAQFILESLRELEEEIKEIGGSIEFIKGRAVDEIPRVMESFGAEHCYAQKEDAWEETEQERLLANQINLILTGGKGIWEEADLPFALESLPAVFSSFRRKVEKKMQIRSLFQSPEKYGPVHGTQKQNFPHLLLSALRNIQKMSGRYWIFGAVPGKRKNGCTYGSGNAIV